MKNKSDAEVFKLYQQAKREIDSFIAIGSKEDDEQIADLKRKKVEPKKVIEAEQEAVKEAKVVENPKEAEIEKVAENVTSSSQSVNRKGFKRETFARKKRKVEVQSSDESKDEEEKEKDDEVILQVEKARVMALTTWSVHEEPGVIHV